MSKVKEQKELQKKLQKARKINDPMDVYVMEKISLPIAKLFHKLGLSPNVATVCSMVIGITGATFLAFPYGWIWPLCIGCFLVLFSYVFDCADGQIARMGGNGSLYGRCFDGFSDGVVYFAIYVAVSIHIMLWDNIPFTNIPWNGWIFFISVPVGVYFHATQARVADYLKNEYMYITGSSHCELSTTESLKKQVEELAPNKFFPRLVYNSYITYTKNQEKMTPNFQKLHQRIIENGGVIPEKVSEMWKKGVNKTVWLSNLLVFNFRTVTLLTLMCFDQAFWIFPVNVVVLEALKYFLLIKHERLAKRCLEEGFDEI
ncbi:MAG: CDP-alcohol phosphatidyltransferase family protein [Bacilli bacterium]|nr:CDP-alcohol phosphatidyltransferase family protein [Bacilli bacterium]